MPGLRNASVTSLTGALMASGDVVRSQSRQSQSPTISDSGIGMDSNSPSAYANLNQPVSTDNYSAITLLCN